MRKILLYCFLAILNCGWAYAATTDKDVTETTLNTTLPSGAQLMIVVPSASDGERVQRVSITDGTAERTSAPDAGSLDEDVIAVDTTTGNLYIQFTNGMWTGAGTWTPNVDTTPPTFSGWAFNADGDELSFTPSETLDTVDCTELTATMATAGSVGFTGTSSPCTPTTPVYSGDTGTIAGTTSFATDLSSNANEAFSGVDIDNSANTSTAGTGPVETFNANPGYSGFDLDGYSLTGSPDANCTTGDCPLVAGGESLEIVYGEIAVSPDLSISANSDWDFIVEFTSSSNGGDTQFFYLLDSSDTTVVSLLLAADNTIRIRHGASSTYSTFTVVDGQPYHMWVEYDVGTGANGGLRFYATAYTGSESKPTADTTVTNGQATTYATKYKLQSFQNNPGGAILFDNINGAAR